MHVLTKAKLVHKKLLRENSYTDRILFTSAEHLSNKLKNLVYEPCPDFASSDHKPIRGAFSIELNGSATPSDVSTEPISITFRDMSCADLPSMDVGGSSDPYIMFVCDPCDLVLDDRNRKEQKGKQSGGRSDKFKFPRTSYMKKTLNPKWDEQVRPCIPPEASSQMDGAMLFLTVMDYDLSSQDDTMCTLGLNLQELVTLEEGQTKKTVQINRPLLKYGQELGVLACTIDIEKGGIQNASREAKKAGLFARLRGRA